MAAGDLSLTSLRTAKDVSDARARIVRQGQGRMPPRIACSAADHHGNRIRAQEPDLPRRGLREPDLPDAARPFDVGRLGEADVAGKRAQRARPDAHGCGGGAAHIPQPCAEGLDPLPAQIADADCVWGDAADRREPFEEESERVAAAFGRVRAQVLRRGMRSSRNPARSCWNVLMAHHRRRRRGTPRPRSRSFPDAGTVGA